MPRLDRGIQYAAASRLNHRRPGVLGRPVKPGDDTEVEREHVNAGDLDVVGVMPRFTLAVL
ncbi:hypothetical protein BSZ21_36340 [Bradyrhizobium canariense]|nr:hypothetical protein BSZ21_36340 [Bradyrhizobium canariense]